jgi:hypothetical protein
MQNRNINFLTTLDSQEKLLIFSKFWLYKWIWNNKSGLCTLSFCCLLTSRKIACFRRNIEGRRRIEKKNSKSMDNI